MQRLGDQLARLTTELTAEEAQGLEVETDMDCTAESIREREHRAARNREKITALNRPRTMNASIWGNWRRKSSRYRHSWHA